VVKWSEPGVEPYDVRVSQGRGVDLVSLYLLDRGHGRDVSDGGDNLEAFGSVLSDELQSDPE
jgi:hypothetical protein